jgi:hypothetical protein
LKSNNEKIFIGRNREIESPSVYPWLRSIVNQKYTAINESMLLKYIRGFEDLKPTAFSHFISLSINIKTKF